MKHFVGSPCEGEHASATWKIRQHVEWPRQFSKQVPAGRNLLKFNRRQRSSAAVGDGGRSGGGMDPADSLQFLGRYALVILPALVVAEQLGIPLPAVPALLAVGALAAAGQLSIPLVLGTLLPCCCHPNEPAAPGWR